MIAPQELRLGNLALMGEDKIVRILWFRLENACVMEFGVEYPSGIVELDRLKPVELTEEWLIKLGYTSDEPILSDKPMFYRKGNHKIWCPFDRFLDEYYRFEIKYVHQLQNLYFTTQGRIKIEQS
ncbi:hypothetical protein OWR28_02495 [Chryseobacterium sp. 1B4]